MIMDYGTDSNGVAIGLAVLFGVLALYLVVLLGSYALFAWLFSRIFRKAGVAGWKAWVPVYSSWVLLELGGQAGWLALISLVPGLNIVAAVFLCIAVYNIDFAFGKPSAGWLVLFIFVPIAWLAILAFDSSRWDPSRMPVRPIFGANVPWPNEG